MVSELLIHLPEYNKYKVIFMRRKMEEMLASQRLMLQRLGREEGKVSDQELAGRFEEHLRRMENWLAKQANIEVLHAKYDDVIQAPLEHAGRVNRFLGGWLNEQRMAQVVEVSLYRQRIPSTMHSEVQSQDEQEKIRERLEDLGYI
jgi:hypothetical protein